MKETLIVNSIVLLIHAAVPLVYVLKWLQQQQQPQINGIPI